MEEILKIIIKNLSYQKARTALTLLGIVIGIGAIVSLISIGDAMQSAINEQFEQIGTDKMMVIPGAPGAMGFSGAAMSTDALTDRDVKIIERITGVETAFGILSKTAKLELGKEEAYGAVMGMPLEDAQEMFSQMQGFEIVKGRDLKTNDRYSTVIGYLIETKLFDKTVKVRDKLKINNKNFKVVGIMKRIGNPVDDMSILIPMETAKDIFNNTNELSMIFVDARDDMNVDRIVDKIKNKLKKEKGVENFKVQTFGDLQEMAGNILSVIQYLFIGIAAISLLVGGIGIMNIMLMTVMERTREIGIMKAIGATNTKVLLIFLGEAAIVGLIGGLIGFGFGFAGSTIIGELASSQAGIPVKVAFSPYLLVGSMLFSMLVGMTSGAYPAMRAAKLDPVEALRHE